MKSVAGQIDSDENISADEIPDMLIRDETEQDRSNTIHFYGCKAGIL